LPAWRRFKKALTQRNCLLKSNAIAQLNVWNNELVDYGTIVESCRRIYLAKLIPVFLEIAKRFINSDPIIFKFSSGWNPAKELQQTLLEDQDKDLRYGFTHSGPHRADFQLMTEHRIAKEFVSRGQLKLLVISLKLAQIELLRNHNSWACILFDDFAAELDKQNRLKVFQFLMDSGFQIFLTATSIKDFGDISDVKDYKMFHVEHGKIQPV